MAEHILEPSKEGDSNAIHSKLGGKASNRLGDWENRGTTLRASEGHLKNNRR
jgi:hypothetical protein